MLSGEREGGRRGGRERDFPSSQAREILFTSSVSIPSTFNHFIIFTFIFKFEPNKWIEPNKNRPAGVFVYKHGCCDTSEENK